VRVRQRSYAFIITSAATSTLLAAWWLLAKLLPRDMAAVFLPTPMVVIKDLAALLIHGGLLIDIRTSFVRMVAGVAAAFALALPLGIAIATNRRIEAAAEPITSVLRYTPLTAFIPLLMFALGIGEAHKVTVLCLGIFVQLLPIVVESLRSVESNYVDIARSYGFSNTKLIRTILLPRIMPTLVDSIRTGFAIGWAYVILVEYWGAEAGLGHRLWRGQRFNHPDEVYACAVTVGLLGLTCDASVRLLRRLLFPWERGRTFRALA